MLSIIFSCKLFFFAIFSKLCGGFHWNGLSISVFTNIMNNSAQLRHGELQLHVLFLLIILECVLQQHWIVLPVFVFFLENHEFRKNLIKICKTMRNKEPTVRLRERQWNCVTHGETLRVESSDNRIWENRTVKL